MKLDIPVADHEIYVWARKQAALMDRGEQGSLVAYPSRERRFGKGERMGLAGRGRLTDFRILHSYVRQRLTFRYNQTPPKRRAILLLDLRDVSESREFLRLMSCAVLIAATLKGHDDTVVSWAPFGADRLLASFDLPGEGFVRILRGATNAYLSCRPSSARLDDLAQRGRVVRALANDPDAHVIIVSHAIEVSLISDINFNNGCTAFLIEPTVGELAMGRGFGTIRDFGLSFQAVDDDPKLERMARALAIKRIRTAVVTREKLPLEAVTQALELIRRQR